MFLYPLSRMTGGIYYEHAHRLFGSLVGLTMIVLAYHLWRMESRMWLRWLAVGAVILVIIQGILGGLRVTGHFTLSTDENVVQPNIYLAIVHGVLGQILFAFIVSLAVFTPNLDILRTTGSQTLGSNRSFPQCSSGLPADHPVSIWGIRPSSGFSGLLFLHQFCALIFLNAIGSGVRAWGLYPEQPVLNRLGLILMGLVVLQLTLGVGALAAIGYANMQQRLTVLDVTVTTAHQATGALLLVVSVLLMLWSFRLLQKPVAQQNPADALPSAQNASLHS